MISAPRHSGEFSCGEDILSLCRQARRTDKDISGQLFENDDFESEDLSYVSFLNCKFIGCRFHDCDFEKSSFVDVSFENCDLSNSSMRELYTSRCEVKSCKLLGINVTNAVINDLKLISCNASYSVTESSKLSSVLFDGCDFTDAEITECSLRNFEVKQSRFCATSFFRTSLSGIDFSSCTVSGLRVSDTFRELKNAVFSASQSVELALLLGIKIK